MLRNTLALSMFAASALAEPVKHHAHRREAVAEPVINYVTLWQTYYVTAGDDGVATTVSEAAPAQTQAAAETTVAAAPAETTAAAVEDKVAVTTSSAAAAVETSPSAETHSTSSASSSSTSSKPGVGSAGALGITYSPYSNAGACKSTEQITSEIQKLSGYSVIRLYGVDCNQVSAVYHAKAAGQKLFLGVFDVGNIENDIQAIHDALNGDWSSVETVSIGNELVNNGQASVAQVAQYVKTGRSKLQSLGYSGPVVTVDTFIATINNPDLCDVSDYIAVNAHAFFDGGVTSSQAGEWANQQIQRVWGACGGKKQVTIVESGWPSQGNSNGKAVASPEDQAAAISSLKNTIGDDCYLFTAFNDLWKHPGYLGVEQWWGIYGSSSN